VSIQTVLTTTGHDILTVAAGVATGAAVGGTAGFVAAVGRRTRPGPRIVDTATVPVAVAAVLAVILIAGPGGPAIVTLVAATTFIRFVSRTRDVVAESLSRPPVQALFVSGAPTRSIIRRHVLPIVAPPLLRDVLGSVSIGVFVAFAAGYAGLDPAGLGGLLATRTADGDALIPVLAPVLAAGVIAQLARSAAAAVPVPAPAETPALTLTEHAGGARVRRSAEPVDAFGDDDGFEIHVYSHPALDIDHLAIDFAGTRPAVRNISLRVDRGQILALVGETGSGKTMTAHAITGLLPPTATATGSIRVDGVEVLNSQALERSSPSSAASALLLRDPRHALDPRLRIGTQIGEVLRAHSDLPRHDHRARALDLLDLVDFPDPQRYIDAYPGQLTTGDRQRAAIALAMATEPALLVADEPTATLDTGEQAALLALLRRLRDRTDVGILLITHDLGVVADIADRAVVAQRGEVVERAGVFEWFARPNAIYAKRLHAIAPKLPAATFGDDGLPELRTPILEVSHLHVGSVPVSTPSREVDLQGRNVIPALRDISFSIGPGSSLGVVGESGSGKTALVRVVAGLIPVGFGRVALDGTDMAALSGRGLRDLRRRVALLPQDPATTLDPRLTVVESVAEPLLLWGEDAATATTRATELLDAVGAGGRGADRRPGELTDGARQRVALARALALAPDLIVTDDPTRGLDVSVQASYLRLFTELRRRFGFAALYSGHDIAVVAQVADDVLILRRGRVVESGPVRRVLTVPVEDYTQRLVDTVPYPDPVVQRDRHAAESGSPWV
jgi:peptide/nickel transport system ATP-binding protein